MKMKVQQHNTYVQHKNEEFCFSNLYAICQELYSFPLHVLFQLAHRVLQCCTCVVDLIHNQNILPHQAGHFQR